MKFLQSTGNAVRVGILVALLWAGALWGWHAIGAGRLQSCEDRYLAEQERIEKDLEGEPSESVFMFMDPRVRAKLDEWEESNPRPGEALVFWPDGVRVWGLVVGAYVCLVVVVQLRAGNRRGPVEAVAE